jgi:hypothetical protein
LNEKAVDIAPDYCWVRAVPAGSTSTEENGDERANDGALKALGVNPVRVAENSARLTEVNRLT